MNYFELFDLPLSFVIDETVVKNRYDQFIDKYRPDFSDTNGGLQQVDGKEKILLAEAAYLVFQNSDETIRYVLELKKFLPDNNY